MKNIFFLPTDEPSRLWFDNLSHKLVLSEMKTLVGYKASRNVYITNDEEIKEGDFYFDSIDFILHRKSKYNDALVDGNKNAKKIILTTDYDLIEEGVQAIDDEFLKWFVKNPGCEFVHAYNDRVVGYPYDNYTTIIPEERKPWIFCETPEEKCTMNYCDENGCQNRKRNLVETEKYPICGYAPGSYWCECVTCKKKFMGDKRAAQCEPCALEMVKMVKLFKKETVVEAAERYENSFKESIGTESADFQAGAKWQLENMPIHIYAENTYVHIEDGTIIVEKNDNSIISYSEDDLREAFKQSRQCKIFEKDMPPVYEEFEDWFKQFKKK